MIKKKNILVITTSRDVGVDLLIKELRKNKEVKVFRFNTEEYPQKIKIRTYLNKDGKIDSIITLPYQNILNTSDIFSVFYRREAEPILSPKIKRREDLMFARIEVIGELDTLWDTINCFWVNHPRYSTALMTKVAQTYYAGKVGFRVPKTLVSTDYNELVNFYYNECGSNVVAKQLGNARGAQDWIDGRLYTQKIEKEHLKILKYSLYAPVMFQEAIPKKLELRITVIGNRIFAVSIDSQANKNTVVDWRRGPIGKLKHSIYKLPLDIEKKLTRLHRLLGLVYSGTDMIVTPSGEYVLLELNPNGEYVWTEILAKLPMTKELAKLLVEGRNYVKRGGVNPAVPKIG